jgi:hypothetical protein
MAPGRRAAYLIERDGRRQSLPIDATGRCAAMGAFLFCCDRESDFDLTRRRESLLVSSGAGVVYSVRVRDDRFMSIRSFPTEVGKEIATARVYPDFVVRRDAGAGLLVKQPSSL